MPISCILDRELVKREFLLQGIEFLRVRIPYRDPYETIRPADVFADIRERNIRQLYAPLVGNAVDEHRNTLTDLHITHRPFHCEVDEQCGSNQKSAPCRKQHCVRGEDRPVNLETSEQLGKAYLI